MKGHQIHIFATKSDLEALLRAIESKRELQFVKGGFFDIPVAHRVTTLLDDGSLGIATKGDNNHEMRYLVADRTECINMEAVPQYRGGMKYAIGSQKTNPKTIVFWPGGVFGENCIISGSIDTVSNEEASLVLFKMFNNEIKRQFKRIQTSWVGREAAELLDKGWRLTSSVNSPPLYDLKR